MPAHRGNARNRYKLLIMTVLLSICFIITYYFHSVLEYGTVFTHFFYIPIILATLWWKRKGMIITTALAGILIVSHVLFRSHVPLVTDILRAFMFVTIGLVFTLMSEQIEKATKALEESERTLMAILEGSPIPAFVIDTHHRITHWNRTLEKMSGLPATDMLGTDNQWQAFYDTKQPCMADILIEEEESNVCKWYAGAEICLESEFGERMYEATDFFPALGEDGKWIRFAAAVLKDAKGKQLGAIEILEDITDRKRAEEALKESEQKLKTILAGSPLPTFIIGKDHGVMYWNRALEELSGIKAEHAVGKKQPWKAFYDSERPCLANILVDECPEEIPRWYDGIYQKSVLIDEAYEATDFFPLLGKNGKWLRFTAATLRDSKGFIIGVIETLEDITDRKIAEEALKESEQQLQSVIEGSPIPTFVIDNSRRVLFWNRALAEMSGIRSDEVVGTSQHWRAFYDKQRPCIADLLIEGMTDEIPRWYVGKYHKLKLIDDAYEATDFFPALGTGGKWLRFTAAILRNSSGTVVGAIETLEDITARKLAEEALKESEMRYMELSITDGLTRLFNSRHFYTQLKAEVERADRYNHPLSLLMLDIDNFKHYNDTYGHLEGDKVLQRLGQVIQRCLRKTDSGYRYGGEEFTLILPETQGQAALPLAERIRQEFEEENFSPKPDTTINKTISIGVTEYSPGEELSNLLKRVDEGMYKAKEGGKNQVCYAEP